ncbi:MULTISPECIES: hypothetical protein [Psychrobacter]|jgi:hypothetical protein|uniref:hypothetical protein n=1 Tax=Psychrobacter TaxID=497 RepID=UPI00086A2873|nr:MULTISPECIES: hypothetical protein [Psychrobacter]MBA6245191.1 hypothetical protein [Psychrobacter sp. Urea-trap-18]MBA6285592.1 hypothetical protein [Psychrobacter sp. Urea-trap-16]MBA6318839.1 hypothetical protein [Psychrobacter sp. Urea-trap-20]MBA6334020.1 hypothetical protein [Psychrobacter sp. Urea-trap-19]OEH68823.1 MAG: hypothetical protein BAX61_01030 [Psychrobacter sp. B29-1]|tara:strand:+ start:48 stop:629 length:582 start_codon:yes stop_codon:yes gene_type:complete
MNLRPTSQEEVFLSLAYNRFYDLADEIIEDSFWEQEDWYRFSKVINLFSVYAELLAYEPFKYVLEAIKKQRPPMESEIGGPLFKFIRNTFAHFPLFESWNEVWLTKGLVNWQKEGLTIDRFLQKYAGHTEIKYRFWEAEKKKMTYISINFPEQYDDKKIYLSEILSEKDGVKFSLIMMRNILNTQVESIKNGI